MRNSRNSIMALGLIDLIHNRPAIFHVLKDWWDKIDVTWFLRGQERDKIYQCKKSWSRLFSLKNRKFRMEWKSLVGSDHCYFFGRSSDRRCSHSDKKWCKTYRIPNCTFCMTKIVYSFWENKQTRTRLLVLANFITCLAPWNTTWHCFHPINP